MVRFRDVLGDRNFLLVWTGQIVSQFGDRLNQMALIALVYKRHPGSVMELAKLFLFIIIPVFVIGPVAGVYADRWDRRRTMIVSDLIRGALVLLIPLCLAVSASSIPVYLLVFLVFSVTRFFLSSKMAIIPDIVTKDKLLIANSLNDTTRMIATVISLPLAGVLVSCVGVVAGFYLDAVTYFISALCVMCVAVPGKGNSRRMAEGLSAATALIRQVIRKSVLAEIKEGFQFLLSYAALRFVTIVFFILMAGLGAISCVIIVFVQKQLGSVTRDLGILGMVLGLGLFCGTMLFGRFGQKLCKKWVVFISFLLSGVIVMLFAVLIAWFHATGIALGMALFLGITAAPIMIAINTLAHEALPDGMRGRVFSAFEVAVHVGFLLFMFLASVAAEYVDTFWIILAVGGLFTLAGLAGIFVPRARLQGTG